MSKFVVLLLLFSASAHLNAEEPFDVRHHLSTATRYDAGKIVSGNIFQTFSIPDQCTPIHLNLVARHGTRAPTKKRIKELNDLAPRLEILLRDIKEEKVNVPKVPVWLRTWRSPWKVKLKGGELTSEGEDELYNLGIRIRDRFPQLFNEDYHPDVYVIKASQVPRASASAVAFGMGLFSGKGNIAAGRHRAFAVTSESRASDILLRFHDCCKNYKAVRKSREPAVHKLKEPVFDEITSGLVRRYGLNFTRQDTLSLWFLCKQEASLLNVTDQACSLFDPSEISLLEWTDDLKQFILKGYGNSLNYRMGVPLLEDVVQSMEQAITAKEEGHPPGNYEKARLRFAHAETLIPFSCLLGLFLEGSEFEQILKKKPMQLPKPPQKRNWRGSVVAPFAGNNALVLYSCPNESPSKYFVQIFHNEHPVRMPPFAVAFHLAFRKYLSAYRRQLYKYQGCGDSNFCPFDVFKEKIVAPHLKHDYNTLCNMEMGKPDQGSFVSKLSHIFHWFFPLRSNDGQSTHADL